MNHYKGTDIALSKDTPDSRGVHRHYQGYVLGNYYQSGNEYWRDQEKKGRGWTTSKMSPEHVTL